MTEAEEEQVIDRATRTIVENTHYITVPGNLSLPFRAFAFCGGFFLLYLTNFQTNFSILTLCLHAIKRGHCCF